MSLFDRILKEQEEKKAAGAAAAAERNAELRAKRATFEAAFRAAVDGFVKARLEAFVNDAQTHAFPAELVQEPDPSGNPCLEARFIPKKNVRLNGVDARETCVYRITALLAEQKVEYAMYFNQFNAKEGVKRTKFGITSLTQTRLEDELDEFARKCTDAADDS